MNVCAKCGFENNANAKKCANCLTDLHWAKVNLGKFHGNADDTRRIGIESRKERGLPILEDEFTPLEAIQVEKNDGNNIIDEDWLLIGLLVGIVPALFFAVIARESIFGFGGAFCFGSLGIPFTLIGSYIGKRSNKTVWIGAVLGMILGVGLLIALLSTCFFCQ